MCHFSILVLLLIDAMQKKVEYMITVATMFESINKICNNNTHNHFLHNYFAYQHWFPKRVISFQVQLDWWCSPHISSEV